MDSGFITLSWLAREMVKLDQNVYKKLAQQLDMMRARRKLYLLIWLPIPLEGRGESSYG